ncbi:MAG: DNA topoisomerase VI subunit B [bacterium]
MKKRKKKLTVKKKVIKKITKEVVQAAASQEEQELIQDDAAIGKHAVRMAEKQREISVSEFFLKNRHLLGFDNPKKALLTTIKEGVDNSLDACEEAKIHPEIGVEIVQLQEDRFRIVIEDNGPGIVKEQIPKIFGKLLYGSKFHTMKQARGQQGIGISSAGMYGQLTTGQPIKIYSKVAHRTDSHYFEIHIDTNKNVPVVLKDEIVDWKKNHGIKVIIELEGKYQQGNHSVDDYVRQVVVANPHVVIKYLKPTGEEVLYKSAVKQLPKEPLEIKPHPHGVELGILMKMLKSTRAKRIKSFLTTEFSRLTSGTARQILKAANISEIAWPSRIAHQEADDLYKAINQVKIMNPPTNCLSPIGEENILKGLKKEIPADFYAAVTRAPSVYRGNPFQIEAGVAYGGDLPKEELVEVMRFANRVPLLYQQSGCAIAKSIVQTMWKNYGMDQSRGALPTGPAVIFVHIASVWVPFTSESKEAVASYPEIIKETKLALQDCGRKLGAFIKRGVREAELEAKKSYIESYIPHIGIALQEILKLKEKDEKKVVSLLTAILEKKRI